MTRHDREPSDAAGAPVAAVAEENAVAQVNRRRTGGFRDRRGTRPPPE
ncbi:hypothetical protein [Streptomyces humidus]|nr:hypothetical protein [Streptomyces humidus]